MNNLLELANVKLSEQPINNDFVSRFLYDIFTQILHLNEIFFQ